jgi:hypothetical protein
MEKKWWEGIISFLCDFWWIIVAILAIGLAIYFTRDLWMTMLF